MPDMIDAAQELDELFNSAAVACATGKSEPIAHYAHCLWCGTPMPEKHGKFCDANCRDDHDRARANRARVLAGEY